MKNIDAETQLSNKIRANNEVHYFTSSFGNWNTNKDLQTCLEFQKKSDKEFAKKKNGKLVYPPVAVYLVPLPSEAHYQIRNYAPADVDEMLIAEIKNEDWYDAEHRSSIGI